MCISFLTCLSGDRFLPRPYKMLADELIEILAACHLRRMCSVADGSELRMKCRAPAKSWSSGLGSDGC